MPNSKVVKVTISLPRELVELADTIAVEAETSRSAVLAQLLREQREARLRALMAQGYQELAEENLRDAEEALPLTGEVVLGND